MALNFLQPKDVTLKARDGTDKHFIIGMYPAIAGREIICQYPLTAIPKMGDYKVNEETMLKLMAFVAVRPSDGGDPIALTTRALVDQHVAGPKMLMQLEKESLGYNVDFFDTEVISRFLKLIAEKAPPLAMKILTDFSAQYSQKTKQPSKS